MQEYTYKFQAGIKTGLRSDQYLAKDHEAFKEISGAFTDTEVLRSLDTPSEIDVSSLSASYPFPQIFELITKEIIVCTEDKIYEYDQSGDSFTLKLTVSEGGRWSLADYHQFIVLYNGRDIVTRDGISGTWSAYTDCLIPYGICVCNLNGQLIVGGPDTRVSSGFRG